MSLFVEFHLIQNFAPSNLNRDDTGAPKDAVFGGYRRARVSSQCFKRAIRMWFKNESDLSPADLGKRTQRLDRLLVDKLREIGLVDISFFNELVKLSIKGKKGKDEKDKDDDKEEEKLLSYLLFISPAEIQEMGRVVTDFSEEISNLSKKKKLKPTDISVPLKDALKECLRQRRAVDIALFGRMLADLPEVNQDAACQVAHAISTHRVEREFDYFTAVDDMGGADETGAGMIGQVEFNSATFYRYSVVDPVKLAANLQQDGELALTGLHALTLATARAIPTGKQNTFAAHNPPSFIGVAIRHASPLNLANAFEKPVYARGGEALTQPSVAALADYDSNLSGIYGDANDAWAYIDLSGAWPTGKGEKLPSLNALADWVVAQVRAKLEQ